MPSCVIGLDLWSQAISTYCTLAPESKLPRYVRPCQLPSRREKQTYLRHVVHASSSFVKSGERTDRGLELGVCHTGLVVLENAADHVLNVAAGLRIDSTDVTPAAVRKCVDLQTARADLVGRASLELGVDVRRNPQEAVAQEVSQGVGFRAVAIRDVRKNMRTCHAQGRSTEGKAANRVA